jgi:hypothetical protein
MNIQIYKYPYCQPIGDIECIYIDDETFALRKDGQPIYVEMETVIHEYLGNKHCTFEIKKPLMEFFKQIYTAAYNVVLMDFLDIHEYAYLTRCMTYGEKMKSPIRDTYFWVGNKKGIQIPTVPVGTRVNLILGITGLKIIGDVILLEHDVKQIII